ncbi:MAG TPA: hypothetical protein VM534_02020 [Thermoanaerobaculia bacterium]|nr:hypothetical protein [Thermoanaerobaculia bacterium]
MAGIISRATEQWQANALGRHEEESGARSMVSLDDRVELDAGSRSGRYLWYRLTREGWKSSIVFSPMQPLDGFAVPFEEDPNQVRLLCTAYERSDEPGRELIRRLADLAILEKS